MSVKPSEAIPDKRMAEFHGVSGNGHRPWREAKRMDLELYSTDWSASRQNVAQQGRCSQGTARGTRVQEIGRQFV